MMEIEKKRGCNRCPTRQHSNAISNAIANPLFSCEHTGCDFQEGCQRCEISIVFEGYALGGFTCKWCVPHLIKNYSLPQKTEELRGYREGISYTGGMNENCCGISNSQPGRSGLCSDSFFSDAKSLTRVRAMLESFRSFAVQPIPDS